jgi:signal transduction histidine kinase/ActR/RegA family two-component response regulator
MQLMKHSLPRSPIAMHQKVMWRVLHLGFWLSALTVLSFAAFYLLRGQSMLALAEMTGLGIMVAGYVVGLRKDTPRIGLQTIAVADWLLLAVLIVMHGGLRSPAVAWIVLLAPLLMLAGLRLALAMTAATVVFMAGLYWAEASGWLPPVREVPLLQRAVSAALIACLFAIFAWYALNWRNRLATELEVARDTAIEANSLKDRFIANMNHEIRTPLNALVAGARLIGRKSSNDEEQALVKAMQHSADHLLALVNDVLDHARLEAGEVRIEPIEFSLRELADSALGMFGAAALSKSITLQLEFDQQLPDVWIGEPTRLRQVLTNLLSNAVKFTQDRGRVTLRVAGARLSLGGSALRFEVQDSGPGISVPTQARLFRAFEQGDSSITRRFGGTGLGLSICKDLLRLMDGTIELESRPGEGSTFRVIVPLAPARSDPDRPVVTRTTDRAALPAEVTVLLVEDDAVNRIVMEAVLRDLGVRAISVDSGASALALLETTPVDLVLMDCQMPGMDGLTVARHWRIKEPQLRRRRVPIIALTGEAHAGARAACLEAGMDDYLTKPVSGRDLGAVLSRWVDAA